MSRRTSSQEGTPEHSSDSGQTVASPAPSQAAADEVSEVESIDLGNVDQDFTTVENDINQL